MLNAVNRITHNVLAIACVGDSLC